MDFARKILGKYGWKDGEGLGKNSNGIAKPLRATLKFDSAGFGADQAASDFNNHWWERVFNDAASNVEVKHDGQTIKMDLVDNEDGVEISTKGYSMKKLRKAKKSRSSFTEQKSGSSYNNFLQAATLTNTGGEILNPNRIEAGDIEVTKVKVLTDEELFKACGGRTAHKGARHGLKLSGKLARIEQQEEELLARMLAKRDSVAEEKGNTKNVKNKIKEKTDVTNNSGVEDPSSENNKSTKQEKKKRKQEDAFKSTTQEFPNNNSKRKKEKTNELQDQMPENQNSDINESTNEKKSKKKKNKHQDFNVPEVTDCLNDVLPTKSKKKKKKDKCVVDNVAEEIPVGNNIVKKNKKK